MTTRVLNSVVIMSIAVKFVSIKPATEKIPSVFDEVTAGRAKKPAKYHQVVLLNRFGLAVRR